MEQETTKTPDAFLGQLRSVGTDYYHHKHPFHHRMHSGKLTQEQIQSWITNRFYYQRNLPLKDAAIISNCPVREVRRIWLSRIVDHDGARNGDGGLDAWLTLAEAAGLTREEVLDERHVLPGFRAAVDTYVDFARTKPWPLAVASSLSELFVPDLMQERIAAFEQHYAWVKPEGLQYFRSRITQASLDSAYALEITLKYCDTHQIQKEAIKALKFKCEVLWSMLDALE